MPTQQQSHLQQQQQKQFDQENRKPGEIRVWGRNKIIALLVKVH